MIPAYNFSGFVYHLFCELALHCPFSILTENLHHLLKLRKYILRFMDGFTTHFLHANPNHIMPMSLGTIPMRLGSRPEITLPLSSLLSL